MNRSPFVAIILLSFLFINARAQTLTHSAVTGTISACEYYASSSPNLQQFTLSGTSLIGAVSVQAAGGDFELSLTQSGGYNTTLTLNPTAGILANTVIYVRTASTDPPTALSIKVQVTSPGANTLNIDVSGTVSVSTNINPVSSVSYNSGDVTSPISFSGTASNFSWTNDTPGIGLPASGTGNIPSFTTTNTTGAVLTATITASPQPNTPGGCAGPPTVFTIKVAPQLTPIFTVSGSLSPLNTIYGVASTSTIFTVSGTNIQGGILITPPAGFEVSTDGNTFSSSVTVGGSGTVALTTIYVRLAATTHVGSYSGNIVLSTTGAADQNEVMPQSVVTQAQLLATADDKSRAFGVANPPLTVTYTGFVNGDGPAQLSALPVLTTTATITSPVGQYPITIAGGTSRDYIINPVDGILTIIEPPGAIVIPNTFTPNGDGVNDTWNIKYLDSYVNCLVDIFNRYGQKVFSSTGYGTPWDGTYKGARLPVGIYYYVIDLKTGYKPFSGYIAIVR